MRADRLLSTLLLLQAHGRQTGRQIASRLEVSERTVHRDMEALSAAGVPVFALRGQRGGWQLDDNWRTQVPAFDEAEFRALLMSQPRVIGDPRLAAAAERAFNKLIAALPVTLRAQAASMRQRLHVDVTGWWGVPHVVAALPIVQDAVARDRKLSFQYRRTSGERAERKVDPLGLVAKGTTWYLVANTPNGLRTYRVSRIEEAVLLDAPSVRPPDFDLAAYWKSSTTEFLENRTRYEATLRLTPDAAAKLKTWHICSPAQAAVPAEPDGSFVVRVRFEDEEQALFVVLGFGSRAAVIEPLSLRARVGAEISAMVKEATRSSRASDRESGDSAAVPVPS
jgi:predicted DNA-binding transcriptional regulator YafY